jgi:hypothetical protein
MTTGVRIPRSDRRYLGSLRPPMAEPGSLPGDCVVVYGGLVPASTFLRGFRSQRQSAKGEPRAPEEGVGLAILLPEGLARYLCSGRRASESTEDLTMPVTVAQYVLDDGTIVSFEADLGEGYRPAGAEQVIGSLSDAIQPAVQGARAVLEKMKDATPTEIEVKFGIKVSGSTNWLVARAATDANFEVRLMWKPSCPAS